VDTLAKLDSSELKDLKVSTGHRSIILANARNEARTGPSTFHSVCGDLGLKIHGMWDELTSLRLWQGVVGEFLAAGIYVFIVIMIIVSSGLLLGKNGADDSLYVNNLPADRYLSIAIGAGFAFTVAVFTFNPIGAGHVSPAITFAYLITSAVTPLRWFLYLCAQLIGGLVGAGFAYSVNSVSFNEAQGGRNIPEPNYWNGGALAIEVLTTFILVLAALSFTDRRRSRGSGEWGPIVLGLVVLVVHLIALPIDGASMNPTRSFASSALYHSWDIQWVYWLGPALGSLAAALWYELFLRDKSLDKPGHRHSHLYERGY